MGIEGQVEATLEGLGYELVELRILSSGRRVCVFIDKEDGIRLSDCEAVTHQLEGLFAAEGFDYGTLEVSSPGPARRLSKPQHFRRFSGSSVEVTLKEALEDDRRRFRGVYELSDDESSISLECEGVRLAIPLDGIKLAKLTGNG